MAFKYKQISNPVTGQDILFLQTGADTGGMLLEMEAAYGPGSKEPAAHYHPFQSEEFTVVSGQLTIRMDGEIKLLAPGDTLHIPENRSHAMWNASGEKTIVNWKVRPAMNTDQLLETMTGLAADGRTTEKGMPAFLQTVLIARRYSDVLRLSSPPYVVQKILFLLLTPFAYLRGYKPVYRKYLD